MNASIAPWQAQSHRIGTIRRTDPPEAMMFAASQQRLSFDDWLASERTATDQRSEYVAGEVFAMAGGTEVHNLIVLNVGAELRNQLKDRPCRVYASDMKVHTDGTWSLSSDQHPSESIPLRVVEAELSLSDAYDQMELSRSPSLGDFRKIPYP